MLMEYDTIFGKLDVKEDFIIYIIKGVKRIFQQQSVIKKRLNNKNKTKQNSTFGNNVYQLHINALKWSSGNHHLYTINLQTSAI